MTSQKRYVICHTIDNLVWGLVTKVDWDCLRHKGDMSWILYNLITDVFYVKIGETVNSIIK